jgi:tripartite-type tricarboxylate transporter receptor subunit TctC
MSELPGGALSGILILGSVLLASVPSTADPVADFYKDKQIRFIVRTPPGGDYDQYTRLIARFMGRHIPGNPSMIAVNMPGGGGITAANYMA